MEHLPPVSKPFEPILVPYVGDREYDGLDFAAYPARRGFDLNRLLEGDFDCHSSDEIASFLQTWLFFGLIHAVLGVTVNSSDFVRTDAHGMRWMTTEKLPEVLHNVRKPLHGENTFPQSTPEAISVRHNCIAKCFTLAQDAWDGCVTLEERSGVANPMSSEISLGIQILAITLHFGASQLHSEASKLGSLRDLPWEKGRHFRRTQSTFLMDRMLRQGWCPVMIEQLRLGYSVLGQYYASLLGRPQRKLDHGECIKGAADCEAMIKFCPESIKHATAGCQCESLIVNRDKLADIIGKDEIPVLRLVQENEILALEIVSSASESGLEYTALSHVYEYLTKPILKSS
jgi:hypothetical protein